MEGYIVLNINYFVSKARNTFLFSLFILSLFSISTVFSQDWCNPNITQTFSHGINSVALNGTPPLERFSGRLEGYVNTGVSTSLSRGGSYTLTMVQGFGAFCTAGNLRIWIDYNHDFDFDDAGELVGSMDQVFSTGPNVFNFTVPNTAVLGTTRMRVGDKMREACGHTGVTPCNDPPDPAGYHGEMEDYDIIIVLPTGISNVSGITPEKFGLYQNYPNPFNPVTNIKFDVASTSQVKITVYDLLGNEAAQLVNERLPAGTYKTDWDASSYPSGVYYYKITAGEYSETHKMALVK